MRQACTVLTQLRTFQAWADATSDQFHSPPDLQPYPPPPPPLGVAGDAPASIAAVYTAVEFQRAFHEGVRDIEIYAHLDLRTLDLLSQHGYQIGYAGPLIRSIRVRIWLLSNPNNPISSWSSYATSSRRFPTNIAVVNPCLATYDVHIQYCNVVAPVNLCMHCKAIRACSKAVQLQAL